MSKSRSGAPRRVAAGLLAGALAVVGLALAPPAGAADDVTTDRTAGVTRYGTAAAIAGQADFDGATTAVLATGEAFPDALAASGYAGNTAPAPIVLTESDNFTDETRVALSELESLTDVVIAGGTAAVSEEVAEAVAAEGYTVTREAGTDRYETAAALADDITVGQIDGLDTALIASGEVFADALAGGPVAYAASLPILLVNSDGIPASTEAALDGIEQAVILGGTARISEATEAELAEITGNPAVRVAGVDRFETAAEVARFAEAELGWGPEEVLLANGLNFPDALAGGPLGGERMAPILLTASVPDATAEYLDEISDTLETITALGGTAAVSDEDLATAETQGETTENDTPTGGDTQTQALEGPELQSCSVTGIDLDDLEMIVSFVFDEDVDESVEDAGFKLYNADTDNPVDGTQNDDSDEVEASGETVDVTFSVTDYAVLDAKLCAVEEGAVEDEDGNSNPPQSVGISSVADDGGTQLADLVSASVTSEDEDGDDDEVTFVFSQATTVGDYGRSMEIILEDGTEVVCTGEEAGEDDEGDEEVTATCPIDQDDPDGDPARAVAFQTLFGNTLVQTAELAGGGETDGPDLEGVTLPSEDDELESDQVLFTFDEEIDSPALATTAVIEAFNLYYLGGCAEGTIPCTVAADSLEFDPDGEDIATDSVLATFPDDAINDFLVGAFVREGAVTDEDDGLTNEEGEVEIENEGYDAGEVAGPQLIDVEASIDTTASGSFQDFEVTFTFDIEIDDDDAIAEADFSVWWTNDDDEVESFNDWDECEINSDDTSVTCTHDDDESDVGLAVVGAVAAGAVQSNAEFTTDDTLDVSDEMNNPEGSVAFEAVGFPEEDEA